MTPEQFRANAAGYLDSAHQIVETVEAVLKAGQAMKGAGGAPKVQCPDAIFEELQSVKEKLARVSEWMISPANDTLEKRGG